MCGLKLETSQEPANERLIVRFKETKGFDFHLRASEKNWDQMFDTEKPFIKYKVDRIRAILQLLKNTDLTSGLAGS